MSSGITLTAATRQNLLSLQGTADLLTQTQNRLSTGKKVNSALDDPTSFFTSQALSGRSGDLGSLLNGISNGVQTIQAANQGITSIQKLVDSAKSTANQALADKSAVSSGTAAATASLSGSKTFQALSANTDGTQDFSSLAKDGSVDISLDGGKSYSTIRLDAATLKGSVSDLTKVSAQQVVSAINSQVSANSSLKGKVSASVAADGRINFSTASAGATQQLNVRGSAGSSIDIGYGKDSTTGGPTAATVLGGTFTGITAAGTGATLSIGDGSTAVDVKIDSTSLKADGTALGTAGAVADVADAINVQLKAAGSSVTASVSGGALNFTSQDTGPSAAVTVQGKEYSATAANNIDIGFGDNTAYTTGTFTAGTGTAATGLSATGSDATDGSAKASINGSVAIADATGGPPATAGGLDLSGTKNGSFSIQIGSGPSKTITLNASAITAAGGTAAFASRDSIAAAINTQIAADTGLAGNVSASFDASNKLVLSSTKAGSDQKITVTAAQGATVANNVNIGLGTQTSTINGTDTNTATAISGFGKDSTGSTNTTRQSLAKQFNEILNQITQQAKDSSYNGINLLYRSGTDTSENSLKVTFNETGSSSLTITGAKLDSDGLGLTASTGGFQTDTEINQTLTAITAATSQLRGQASTFGSNLSVVQNRQDFSKNLINILDTGSANLTNADLNEEAANSQALSTRQSIGISALSLANTAQQGILQLLR